MSAPSDARSRGWLYDGQSAIRHEVNVLLLDGRLVIEGHVTVALADLERIDASGLLLGRRDVPGWRLGIEDAPPALIAALPQPPRLGGWLDRIGLWRAAIVLAVLSALTVVATIWGAELAARSVPRSWERKLGDAMTGDFADDACVTPAGQAALDDLARRLSPPGDPMRVKVVDVPIVNAVALPGGQILIFRKLIDEAKSPDELAGVLGHEIGHVEKRHVMVALVRRFGLGLLIGTTGGSSDYAQALLEARYSRSAEAEADDYARWAMRAAHISPLATAGFFARAAKERRSEPGVFAYFASHPAPDDRQRAFAEAAARKAKVRPALNPAAWAAVRSICAGHKRPTITQRLRF
ncbi:M48 family metallopeptidase [Sphingomonas crocodyli]|uniref:M48 family metallopeptidase n=1 Tax=Sphingomonas crocodyli TaxID=1979270 RepID=A0A437M4W9_9SPHN|nr:M48 family metallopeptidase [Sphingomonas crocodyli]RVT92717.1 M48 family metallopeptidase [Sphingomonas crocodyli]